MSILAAFFLGLLVLGVLLYLLAQYVLNEKQAYQLKYTFYMMIVMSMSVVFLPIFLLRPRNAWNIRTASRFLNPAFRLFGVHYRVERAEVLDTDQPCVIVANHQSSIDFIGMMQLWPEHVRYCTILAKKELMRVFPFGFTAWLAGVEYVNRKNRDEARKTMHDVTEKVRSKSLRLWVFPEGTRSMGDTFLPFKVGAFRLAVDAQVPIIPVVFSSYKSIYNADKKTKDFYWRSGCVAIKVLDPIDTKGMTIEKDLSRLTEMTRQRMIDVYQTLHTTTGTKKDT